jgi:hypothetical protein
MGERSIQQSAFSTQPAQQFRVVLTSILPSQVEGRQKRGVSSHSLVGNQKLEPHRTQRVKENLFILEVFAEDAVS